MCWIKRIFCITLKIGNDIESLGQDISTFWIFLIILYLMVIVIVNTWYMFTALRLCKEQSMNPHKFLFTKLSLNFKNQEIICLWEILLHMMIICMMFSASPCILLQGILLKAMGALNIPSQLQRALLCDRKEGKMWK